MCLKARPTWSDMMAMDLAMWGGVVERIPNDDAAAALARAMGR